VPDDSFACKYKEKCTGELARGMQCGIGNRYGEKTKIVIVSLDCGGGGKANIADRTQSVIEHLHNPHMKGTLYCASMLLNFIDFNSEDPWGRWTDKWNQNNGKFIDQAIPFFAMTNACKCCRLASTSKLPTKYYRLCAEYKFNEIKILEPEILIFQGNDALTKSWEYLSNIEELRDNKKVFDSLKMMTIEDRSFYAILSIHPSARQRGNVNEFMNDTFPQIVQYIEQKFSNTIF
jgi:hypothetical protein